MCWSKNATAGFCRQENSMQQGLILTAYILFHEQVMTREHWLQFPQVQNSVQEDPQMGVSARKLLQTSLWSRYHFCSANLNVETSSHREVWRLYQMTIFLPLITTINIHTQERKHIKVIYCCHLIKITHNVSEYHLINSYYQVSDS
jgi:hypothetical protein